jgi:hypothetical protein
MRGRKLQVGEISVTLFVRHSKECSERKDNSGTVGCKCFRWVPYKDGKRESTSQWTWVKAEEEARRIVAGRSAAVLTPSKSGTYSVEKAIAEWIAERDLDGLHNTKAIHMGKKLLVWCQKSGSRAIR